MQWLKQLWCRHTNVEVRTFLKNDCAGPCIERTMKCVDCGHVEAPVLQLAPARDS